MLKYDLGLWFYKTEDKLFQQLQTVLYYCIVLHISGLTGDRQHYTFFYSHLWLSVVTNPKPQTAVSFWSAVALTHCSLGVWLFSFQIPGSAAALMNCLLSLFKRLLLIKCGHGYMSRLDFLLCASCFPLCHSPYTDPLVHSWVGLTSLLSTGCRPDCSYLGAFPNTWVKYYCVSYTALPG